MKGIKVLRKHDNELVYFVDVDNGKVAVHIGDGTFLEIELDDDDKCLYRQSVSNSAAKSRFETKLKIYTQAWLDCQAWIDCSTAEQNKRTHDSKKASWHKSAVDAIMNIGFPVPSRGHAFCVPVRDKKAEQTP